MNLLKTAAFSALLALSATPVLAEPWSFVDGSGKTVSLDETPTRIVAHAIPAAALMSFGIRPVAIFSETPVEENKSLQGLDLTGIEIVGQAWGEIDIEKVAALEPDLIISEYWPVSKTYWGGKPLNEADSVLLQIAPVAGIVQAPSILTMIEEYEVLAGSLGADLAAEPVAAEKARFETALEAFKAAAAAKPNLTVMAVWAGVEDLEVAVPAMASELNDFVNWGLNVITPTDPEGEYWEILAWENADKYQPDLVIVDNRSASVLAHAEEQPTWQTIKAVAAGQVGEWPAYWIRTYGAYASELDKLTASVEAADENLTD
ncbi:ABC transporter substrate-binding protein [Devosia sediminis]|uniref:ABC transporter substrate-binding protein n=1 Tax=Devosia sediminis TaxID=2798801 RepID=A0A934MKK7_9HYPH|nr:ABC transporter substrate-binding protein [Devosia sediminis]MBJ3785253.1 ABC transporter substrate-binding protein [Devosia sediminis]